MPVGSHQRRRCCSQPSWNAVGQQPSSSLQCVLAPRWLFRREDSRATDGAVWSRQLEVWGCCRRNGGCACPRSDAMDGRRGEKRLRLSAVQTADGSKQIRTNRRMTDKQTGREDGVDSSRARSETGTK